MSKRFLLAFSSPLALALAIAPAAAQQTRTQLQTTNNSQINANGQNKITGAILNSFNNSLIQSMGVLDDNNVWTGTNTFAVPIFPGIVTANGTVSITQPNLAPANNSGGGPGSVGLGAINATATRTGGYGEYGHILSLLTVSPSVGVPVGQFDTAITGWATTTNDSGGQAFGAWFGANTPAGNLGESFVGGDAVGAEIDYGNRWNDLGLYTSLGGVRQSIGLQIVPDVLPATDGANTLPVTMTCASPSVVTWTANGLSNNYGVVLGGSPCTGFAAGTTYYVVNATTNTFELSATVGGSAINGTGSTSAVTALASWPGTFGLVISPSAHGHETWVGTLIASDSIVAAGHAHYDRGGSVASNAPLDWTNVQGYWQNGLDLSGAAFSTYAAIKIGKYDNIVGGGYVGTATNASTSPSTGALVTAGGLGVAGGAYIGGLVGTGSRPVCVTSTGGLEAGTLSAGSVTCP